jgi:hypothetical protein
VEKPKWSGINEAEHLKQKSIWTTKGMKKAKTTKGLTMSVVSEQDFRVFRVFRASRGSKYLSL